MLVTEMDFDQLYFAISEPKIKFVNGKFECIRVGCYPFPFEKYLSSLPRRNVKPAGVISISDIMPIST